MEEKIVIIGSGGQGVLLIGEIIAQAGLSENKYISKISTYGAEVRGGKVSCTTIVSDKKIDSPVIDEASILIILDNKLSDNIPSIRKKGLILINTDSIETCKFREDLTILNVPADKIAIKTGNIKTRNMVLLGALIKKTGLFKTETINCVLPKILKSKKEFIKDNIVALKKGVDFIK